MTASLRLGPDTRLLIDGEPHQVAKIEPATGAVTLVTDDGAVVVTSMAWLLDHPGVETQTATGAAPRTGLALVNGAPKAALSKAHKRLQHVLEVETGRKSGNPDDGVTPDPRYDPALVPSVVDRRRAKAAELAQPATDPDQRMSYRTLEREAKEWRDRKLENLVDGRSCRTVTGTRVKPEALDAIEAVVAERKNRSNFQTLDGLALLVRERVRTDHPDTAETLLPASDRSIIRAAKVIYTPTELTSGKAKYRRTKLENTGKPTPRLRITRPGEVLIGDAKDLDVLLQNTVFHGYVRGRLIMWMDAYSRSIPEVRIVLESEKAVDIAQSILACGRPKLMEPGWEDGVRWPYVGLPDYVVDSLTDGQVAGVPFMDAETLVVDNGRPYRSFVNVATARSLGTDVVPARRLRPTDKAMIERSFRTLDTMLCQHLKGYRGPDPSERGDGVENEVRYDERQLEAIIRHWVASVWQRRPLDPNISPAWCPPGRQYSPNEMFNYGIKDQGFRLRFLDPQEYARALPAHSLRLHRSGFKVRGLWYDVELQDGPDGRPLPDPLAAWRRRDPGTPAAARKHHVTQDGRDMRFAWWEDPATGRYVRLTWRGYFGLGDPPAFSDRDAELLIEMSKERRLDPLDGPRLAQALLDLLNLHDPQWNGAPPTKREAKAAARRRQQAESAARDQAAGMDRDETDDEGGARTPKERHESAVRQSRREARTAAGVVGGTAPSALGAVSGGLFADLDAADVAVTAHAGRAVAATVTPIRNKES